MKHPRGSIAFVLSAVVALAAPAWAGRPLATEDAGVLAAGECEIESFAARAHASGNPAASVLWGQLGCGVGGASQVAAGLGRERAPGERTHLAGLSGKTSLRELTEAGSGFALAYTLLAAKPRGRSMRGDASEVRAVLTVPQGAWQLHANLGVSRDHAAGRTSTTWGVALERAGAVGALDLMGEVFGDDRARPWVQVGLRYPLIADRLFIDAAWATQPSRHGDRLVSVGVKHAF